MMFSPTQISLAQAVLQSARARGLKISTAESCTGGLISALLTEIAGSSDIFTHGFVTYANAAKSGMIGVSDSQIKNHGAVSEEVARAMAEGALHTAGADLSIAVTGIAGPGGATANKPVGLVHLATARKGFSTLHARYVFSGSRSEVRAQAVTAALELLQQQFSR